LLRSRFGSSSGGLAGAVALSREHAHDLLIEGRAVGLPVLAHERRRLLAHGRRDPLADAPEDVGRCARRRGSRASWVGSGLRTIPCPPVCVRATGAGVARIERLVLGFTLGLRAARHVESFRQRVAQGFAVLRQPRVHSE
jgi:hypothetical protein